LATIAAPIIPLFFSEPSVATTVTIQSACTQHRQDPAAPPARRGTLDPQGPLHLQLGGLSRVAAQAVSLWPAYCPSRVTTRAVTAAPPALPPKLACPSIMRHGSCLRSWLLLPPSMLFPSSVIPLTRIVTQLVPMHQSSRICMAFSFPCSAATFASSYQGASLVHSSDSEYLP
jgi:hypothetical protein